MLGIGSATLIRWVEVLRLSPLRTPGGQRRYGPEDIDALARHAEGRRPTQETSELELDMVRFYQQGCSIRQVADKFDVDYSAARRALKRHTTLRSQGRVSRPTDELP